MIKRIMKMVAIGMILLNSGAYATTAYLFNITASGTPAAIDIILCLDGKGPLSCQKYHVSAVDLQITTAANHHYPAAGIKILTPGYTATGCIYYPKTGYCLFSVTNAIPKMIYLNSSSQKQNQTITLNNAPSTAVYNSNFTVSATASSELAVTFSSSGACMNSGATYTMTSGAGTCSVIANQLGNLDYNAAPTVTQIVTANPATNTVMFTTIPPSGAVYNSNFTVSASGLGSGAITYSSSGSCSNVGATYTMTSDTGTCTVTATQAADSNYASASISDSVTATSILTSTLVYSSLNPSSTSTSSITLSAQVSSALGAPTSGTVNFTANGTTISGCSAQSLSSGMTTCSTSSLNTNTTYLIVATYSGTTGYTSSTSPSFAQYVATSAPAATVPSAPTYVTAVPGNGQATVLWFPPNDTGGALASNITYTVAYWETATGSPLSPTAVASCTSISALSCVVSGLTNGTAYTFKVTATNTTGVAPYLAGYSSSVTPGDGLVVSSGNLALSGLISAQSRSIQVLNASSTAQTLNSIQVSALPSGTIVTADTCSNATLLPGDLCFVAIHPGTTVSYYSGGTTLCTSRAPSAGATLTPGTVTISSSSFSATTNIYVLGYGCQYQGGYLFSIDDTTPTTGSIGGKNAAAVDQSENTTTWGPDPSYVWGIDQSSTIASPSDDSGSAILTTGQLNCNGNTDGACVCNNILTVQSSGNYPAANECSGLINSTGTSCTSGATCYTGWYLPAICEMGYDTLSLNSGCGSRPGIISNMQYNLIDLPGSDIANLETIAYYWGSTEYSLSYCSTGTCAWMQYFSSTGGSQAYAPKHNLSSVRCIRGLTN